MAQRGILALEEIFFNGLAGGGANNIATYFSGNLGIWCLNPNANSGRLANCRSGTSHQAYSHYQAGLRFYNNAIDNELMSNAFSKELGLLKDMNNCIGNNECAGFTFGYGDYNAYATSSLNQEQRDALYDFMFGDTAAQSFPQDQADYSDEFKTMVKEISCPTNWNDLPTKFFNMNKVDFCN